jgi:hypothetical protein
MLPPRHHSSLCIRLAALALGLVALVGFGIGDALAQSASCAQLNATLQQLNSNRDFSNGDQVNGNLRAVQANERNAESAYIRTGCQRDQQQGFPQTPECRGLARQILSQRAQITQLSQTMASGTAVAQQRETVLQEIARFGCNRQNSGATFSDTDQLQQQPPRRRSFLEQLFGGFQSQGDDGYDGNATYTGPDQVEDPYATQQQQQQSQTIRTVCVRLSDGYYWPISYSTTRDYIPEDAQTCQAACPDQQVDLYFYDNPGQEPEQMIDAEGKAYSALPTAFAYRKQFDRTNTCKPQQADGMASVDDLGDGRSRAMITYGGETFPLPVADPRDTATTTLVTAASDPGANPDPVIDIPLPRPRPGATDAAPKVAPAAEPVISARDRTVRVGDKIVRVVGPDTPYAPATTGGNSG